MIKYEELSEILYKNKHIPYPEIQSLYPNPNYANLIYDSFGGEKGELTAITQYIYEHIDLKDNDAIQKILLNIAIQEMNHLDILGSILVKLGEKPIYKSSSNERWSSNNVNYKECNLKELMEINILSEETAIREYRKLINYTRNMYLRRVYERIILDEMTHIEIFRRIQGA